MIYDSTNKEKIDTMVCAEAVGGSQFEMILIAAIRGREIAAIDKATKNRNAGNPIVAALKDIESGRVGREYLNKV